MAGGQQINSGQGTLVYDVPVDDAITGSSASTATGNAAGATVVRLRSKKTGAGSATRALSGSALTSAPGSFVSGASRVPTGQVSSAAQGAFGRQRSALLTGTALIGAQQAVIAPTQSDPFTITRTGGAYSTLQAAINAAQSGDTIVGVPGTYVQYGVNVDKNLTIKSSVTGQKVVLDAQHLPSPSSHILTVAGGVTSFTLEDFELKNNKKQDNFNAGITTSGGTGTITLRRCKVSECSNGFISSNGDFTCNLVVENCEFFDNGLSSGYYHNFYVGAIQSFTMAGSWVYQTKAYADYALAWMASSGHLVKSRAKVTTIRNCRITMENPGTANPGDYYNAQGPNKNFDISNGGDLTIEGCLVEYRTYNGAGSVATINYGPEAAYNLPGSVFDGRSHKVKVRQNTFVARSPNTLPGGSNRLFMKLWAGYTSGGQSLQPMPLPSEYSVQDNVFCGWLSNTPVVVQDFSDTPSVTYAVNLTTNTSGALTLIQDATTYDYRLVTPVTASQNWTTSQYAHSPTTYPTTITRQGTLRGSSGAVDGTAFVTSPTTYKGNQTFSTLQGVVNGINATTGGWAELPNTRLADVFQTGAEIDQIAPKPVLRQDQWPFHMNAWGSGAWNGYGFWVTDAGGHFAGYANATFMLRVADPVGVARVHNSAPVLAVAGRGDNTTYPNKVIPPSEWATQASTKVASYLEWGPRGCHPYNGVAWDAQRELYIYGGNAQVQVTNPTAYGQTVTWQAAIYTFNPYAPTPKAAWTRYSYTSLNTEGPGAYSFVQEDSGTWLFKDSGPGALWRFDPDAATPLTLTSLTAFPTPSTGGSRPVVRNPATNKFYELNRPVYFGGADVALSSVYDTTSGTPVKIGDIDPAYYYVNTSYQDQHAQPVIVGGKMYLFGQAGAIPTTGGSVTFQGVSYATGPYRFAVTQVDLTSPYTQQKFNDGATVQVPATERDGSQQTINGLWNRAAWVPQVGAFVVLPSAHANAWVFRPPSSWGVG